LKKITSNIVYSTNPDFESENIEDLTMSAQSNQNLRIHLERKRGGKILTVIRGYVGNAQNFDELARELKKSCGVGGSVKNDEILIQGNVREKVLSILTEKGYSAKLSGG
jgi:translation initiation factor 1